MWFSKPIPQPRSTAEPRGLARFDTADRAELDALPPRVRAAVIADRKPRVTASLERFVAAGGCAPLRPRAEVIAGARINRRSKS